MFDHHALRGERHCAGDVEVIARHHHEIEVRRRTDHPVESYGRL
jgi:hypothetical protein